MAREVPVTGHITAIPPPTLRQRAHHPSATTPTAISGAVGQCHINNKHLSHNGHLPKMLVVRPMNELNRLICLRLTGDGRRDRLERPLYPEVRTES
jgi:hypothetical protein